MDDALSLEELSQFRNLCKSFLSFKEVTEVELEEFHVSGTMVAWHFKGVDQTTHETITGWVVGGGLPSVMLSDADISSEYEALVIYWRLVLQWINRKGVLQEDGNIADFRVAPNWHLLDYGTEYQELGITPQFSKFLFGVLPHHADKIVHPEIREMCLKSGWIRSDSS